MFLANGKCFCDKNDSIDSCDRQLKICVWLEKRYPVYCEHKHKINVINLISKLLQVFVDVYFMLIANWPTNSMRWMNIKIDEVWIKVFVYFLVITGTTKCFFLLVKQFFKN